MFYNKNQNQQHQQQQRSTGRGMQESQKAFRNARPEPPKPTDPEYKLGLMLL
jgi:hypothetical protein